MGDHAMTAREYFFTNLITSALWFAVTALVAAAAAGALRWWRRRRAVAEVPLPGGSTKTCVGCGASFCARCGRGVRGEGEEGSA